MWTCGVSMEQPARFLVSRPQVLLLCYYPLTPRACMQVNLRRESAIHADGRYSLIAGFLVGKKKKSTSDHRPFCEDVFVHLSSCEVASRALGVDG